MLCSTNYYSQENCTTQKGLWSHSKNKQSALTAYKHSKNDDIPIHYQMKMRMILTQKAAAKTVYLIHVATLIQIIVFWIKFSTK
jgi:hypothetical protein